jgi:hypothetical protein
LDLYLLFVHSEMLDHTLTNFVEEIFLNLLITSSIYGLSLMNMLGYSVFLCLYLHCKMQRLELLSII